jgi:hypothetical protein
MWDELWQAVFKSNQFKYHFGFRVVGGKWEQGHWIRFNNTWIGFNDEELAKQFLLPAKEES